MTMNLNSNGLILVMVIASVLCGCGRGNGLPSDLTKHLSDRGIRIAPSRVHAPLSSRCGYIVARNDAKLSADIISTEDGLMYLLAEYAYG